MSRFDNHIEALVQRLVAFQGNHLRAGDHDVADALVGDVHHPFEHFARIFVDKVVLPGITNQLQQFITVFRFAVEKLVQNEGEKSLFSGCRVATV